MVMVVHRAHLPHFSVSLVVALALAELDCTAVRPGWVFGVETLGKVSQEWRTG